MEDMKKLLISCVAIVAAVATFGQAANDLILSQRKADNSGFIQRNLAPTANAALGVNASKVPVALTAFTQDSATGAVGVTATGTNQNITLTPSGTGQILLNPGVSGYVSITNGAGLLGNWPAGDRGIQFSAITSGKSTINLGGFSTDTTGASITLHQKDTTANNGAFITTLTSGSLNAARLNFIVENHADAAGRLEFLTRTTTAGGLIERMRITSAGGVNIGGTGSVAAGNLNVAGTTEATTAGAGSLTTAGGIYAAKNIITSQAIVGGVQALSGAGAINVTTAHTDFTSTGGAQALTLADGTVGQTKTIVHVVDGGSGVLTPTTKIGFTTITFTNVGDSVTLRYTSAGWAIVGIFGAVAA